MPRKKLEKPRGKKERGNGRGTVFELPDGRSRWQLRDVSGKVIASGRCKDSTTAEKALAAAITDRERGVLATTDRVSFAEYAGKWLERQPGLRCSTRRMYKTDLAYAVGIIGKMKLKDVRPGHVKDTLATLSTRVMKGGSGKGKTMSTRTLGMVRARLRSVFDEAVRDQIIYTNPVAAVRRVKGNDDPEDRAGVALDFDQAARLHEIGEALHAAGVCRLWPAIFTAVSVGLRRGEVMALRWRDLEQGVLSVRMNLTEENGELVLGKPKTKGSAREIPMPTSLNAALEAHRAASLAESEKLSRAWNPDGPVFATLEGIFTHPSLLDRAVKSVAAWSNADPVERKARRRDGKKRSAEFVSLERRLRVIPVTHRPRLEVAIRAGKSLPLISPHDLRHTAGTLMLRRGMPVEVVSKILGHAKVSITLDVYRHVLESEKKAVMVDLFPEPAPTRAAPAIPLN